MTCIVLKELLLVLENDLSCLSENYRCFLSLVKASCFPNSLRKSNEDVDICIPLVISLMFVYIHFHNNRIMIVVCRSRKHRLKRRFQQTLNDLQPSTYSIPSLRALERFFLIILCSSGY